MDYDITRFDRPSVAVDAAVFGVEDIRTKTMDEKKLKLLLVKRGEEPFRDMFSLPGGFMHKYETAEAAMERELTEETGVKSTRLIPLKVYSGQGRDPRGWIISAAFISLTNTVKLSTHAESDAKEAVWFDFDWERKDRGEEIILTNGDTKIIISNEADMSADSVSRSDRKRMLAFDHSRIILDAFRKLQDEVLHHDIIFNLMPPLFTVSDLHGPYKMILGKEESPQAFRKRMLPKISETDQFDSTGAAHRKSRLYCRKEIKEEDIL